MILFCSFLVSFSIHCSFGMMNSIRTYECDSCHLPIDIQTDNNIIVLFALDQLKQETTKPIGQIKQTLCYPLKASKECLAFYRHRSCPTTIISKKELTTTSGSSATQLSTPTHTSSSLKNNNKNHTTSDLTAVSSSFSSPESILSTSSFDSQHVHELFLSVTNDLFQQLQLHFVSSDSTQTTEPQQQLDLSTTIAYPIQYFIDSEQLIYNERS